MEYEQARPIHERPILLLLTALSQARATGTAVLRDRHGDRHGVCFEHGYVRAVHVAGRFDPLLSLLEARGLVDRSTRARCLDALSRTSARSGAVATLLATLPPPTLRDVIRAQQLARFSAFLACSEERGHDSQFEPGPLTPENHCVRWPLGSMLRSLGRVPEAALPEPSGARPERSAALQEPTEDAARGAKRRLRTLAKAIHPDRHQHLSDERRRELERELAVATARYHGFGHVA